MSNISVVIPSFNHAPFIQQAVESVLQQTETNLELIVVDDGSTDESMNILSTFSDPRMHVIQQENQGAHSAINLGLSKSTGKFLAILNSDDTFHPERLEKAITVLEADENIGLVGSFINIINENSNSIGEKRGYQNCEPWILEKPERSFRAGNDLRAALLTENYWSTTSNFVFPRLWYQRVGEFYPLRYTHDWDFALRMASKANLYLIQEPLINYRVHSRNTIREDQATMIFEICWILAINLPSHIIDSEFFGKLTLETRTERLLHSIYVFGCERVLSVMLLQEIHTNPKQALLLLDIANPVREKYLEFICETVIKNQRFDSQIDTHNGSSGRTIHNFLRLGYIPEVKSWLHQLLDKKTTG